MKPSFYLYLLLLLPALCRAQQSSGLPTAAFPDTAAARLVKTAPSIFLGRPLHSELYYNTATKKAYVATAVLVLHVLRGDSVKNGTLELTADVASPHQGVGPTHAFGNRRYVYNQDAFVYFCTPSKLPRNPAPFSTDNTVRLSLAAAGPGLAPMIQFIASAGAEPTRIYGLGREFETTASLYKYLGALGKLRLPDPKFGKYQRPYQFLDARPDWVGVPTSPSSALADPLTPEEIIQARATILTAPLIFTGMVVRSTRFEDAAGVRYVSELVQPVWVFRGPVAVGKQLVEVVEPEESYVRGLRQNVPVVYFAAQTSLPANSQTKAQLAAGPYRALGGDSQAKVMIGKVGAAMGYNGLYQSFSSPQESWQYINQLPGVPPWLPAAAGGVTVTAVKSAKE